MNTNSTRRAFRMCTTLCLAALLLVIGCATSNRSLSKTDFQAFKTANEVGVFNDGSPRLEYWTKGLTMRFDTGALPGANIILLPLISGLQRSAVKEALEIGESKRIQWNLPDPGERIRERLIERLRAADVSNIYLVQCPRIEPKAPTSTGGYRVRFEQVPTHAAPVEFDRGAPASVAILGSGWLFGPENINWPDYRMVYFVTIHLARAPDIRWTTTARCYSATSTLEQFEANDGALLRRASDELADACVEYLARKMFGESAQSSRE